MCLLPHAHVCICAHEPQRPLYAAAGTGRDHTVRLTQRLQPLAIKTRMRPGPTITCGSGGRGTTRRHFYNGPASSTRPESATGRSSRRCWLIFTSKERDEVFAASLIRLTMAAPDERVPPALVKAMQDPSPLVRAAAAEALSVRPGKESLQALVTAAGDNYRLVRVRAAASLAQYPATWFEGDGPG